MNNSMETKMETTTNMTSMNDTFVYHATISVENELDLIRKIFSSYENANIWRSISLLRVSMENKDINEYSYC
jgi:hypothetical protein